MWLHKFIKLPHFLQPEVGDLPGVCFTFWAPHVCGSGLAGAKIEQTHRDAETSFKL